MEEFQEVRKSNRSSQKNPQQMSKEEYQKNFMKQNPLPTKSKVDFSKMANSRAAEMLKKSKEKMAANDSMKSAQTKKVVPQIQLDRVSEFIVQRNQHALIDLAKRMNITSKNGTDMNRLKTCIFEFAKGQNISVALLEELYINKEYILKPDKTLQKASTTKKVTVIGKIQCFNLRTSMAILKDELDLERTFFGKFNSLASRYHMDPVLYLFCQVTFLASCPLSCVLVLVLLHISKY